MITGTLYKCIYATIIWDKPGELLLCENEKSVINILNKDDIFFVIKCFSTVIQVQKYKNFNEDKIIRSIAYIVTPNGVNGWLVSYNNWQDFEIIDGR